MPVDYVFGTILIIAAIIVPAFIILKAHKEEN